MRIETDAARWAKEYFDRPAWNGILKEVWNKYAGLGRVGGQAIMQRLSESESEALNLFFGWNYRAGDTGEIPLALFDEELRMSRFSPMDIHRLHLLLTGRPLLTKAEQRVLLDEEWRGLFQTVRKLERAPLTSLAEEWLSNLERGFGAGARTLRDLYKTEAERALAAVRVVVRALNWLCSAQGAVGKQRPIRLPVLAARISGNAHALDMNEPAGRIFAAVLRESLTGFENAEMNKEGIGVLGDGSESLRLRETYRSFGIRDDDLSSIVYWYVPVQGEPVLPKVWTLKQVEAAEWFPRSSGLYVVENPAVFSTFLDSMPESHDFEGDPPVLICTSGPASAAAIRFIDKCLLVSGDSCKLAYSGDFDIKGLTMGQTLAGLFPGHFVPWRFDAEVYLALIDRHPGYLLEANERNLLSKMTVSWDHSLCAALGEIGYKLHQETFVEELVCDLRLNTQLKK